MSDTNSAFNLNVGDLRFTLTFIDDDLRIPVVETLIFKEIVGTAGEDVRFVDVSHRLDDQVTGVKLEDFEDLVVDLDGLIEGLVRLRERLRPFEKLCQ